MGAILKGLASPVRQKMSSLKVYHWPYVARPIAGKRSLATRHRRVIRSCTRWMTFGQRGREDGFASSIQLMRSQKPVEYSAPSGPRRPRGKVNLPFRIASFSTPSLRAATNHSTKRTACGIFSGKKHIKHGIMA